MLQYQEGTGVVLAITPWGELVVALQYFFLRRGLGDGLIGYQRITTNHEYSQAKSKVKCTAMSDALNTDEERVVEKTTVNEFTPSVIALVLDLYSSLNV